MKEVLVRVVNLKINIFIDFPLFIIKKKKISSFQPSQQQEESKESFFPS